MRQKTCKNCGTPRMDWYATRRCLNCHPDPWYQRENSWLNRPMNGWIFLLVMFGTFVGGWQVVVLVLRTFFNLK